MKARNRKSYRAITAALSIAAVGLLAFGSVGGARAALTYSDRYTSQLGTQDLSVSITEDGEAVAEDAELLEEMLGDDEKVVVGKVYKDSIGVENTGHIDAFVKVTIHKYWEDANGKRLDLSPELIKLQLNTADWILVDDEKSSDEIVELYYKYPLEPGQSTYELGVDPLTGVSVSNDIRKVVSQETTKEGSYTTVTNHYKYNGVSMGFDIDVDAVQTHHAEDAILSAWGVEAAGADDGTITSIN